jgi:hydroxymethylbilane synthase
MLTGMMKKVILGTRGSALALAQTELTKAALRRVVPDLEVAVEIFVTQGDRKLDLDLRSLPAGGKGLFTKELEEALAARRIDVAVHSLKDLPGSMPEGLQLGAVLERAATADVLISRHPGGLDGLPRGSSVGTSSVRRARQLEWLRPDLRAVEWRGNVQTRLRKLGEQEIFGGILLAQAGLDRLGFHPASGRLQFEKWSFNVSSMGDRMYPAIGQGAIALQCQWVRQEVHELLQRVNHEPTWRAICAERELQRLLAGDCTLPVGVRCSPCAAGMRLEALLFEDGQSQPRFAFAEGPAPEQVAAEVARGLGTPSVT